ncbi:alpha/beta hydrolase [Rhodopirellula halodulae]|uniref:alpha/beta hydrolase n=1 Tax=Rhodopirellula halodulae TaxID=2894198 RepID=UPI001E2AC418|nr:alpha/beta hydrolase [Rhodopirellula sp. JC737]MCC9658200.1 alpha/beta hydrolase [Rhodopirellula sp. JC737]
MNTHAMHSQRSSIQRWTLIGCAAFFSLAFLAPNAFAQRDKRKDDPALKPRPVKLKSKDNVELNAFYFPSKEGKNAIPVLVVHEWKGQASPYKKFCVSLNGAGFAVLFLEYRGHGNSKQYTTPSGEKEDFNVSRMGKRDIQSIIQYDMEEAKQFLKQENNEGRLNLNALTVVGIQQGAIMASHWAVRDWGFPSVGRMKQGQDVKALVYISPLKNFHGLTIDSTMRDRNVGMLPTMIVAGSESPESDEARRLEGRLSALRKRARVDGPELKMANTSLSGPALIYEVPSVTSDIAKFIKDNVPVSESENEWIER